MDICVGDMASALEFSKLSLRRIDNSAFRLMKYETYFKQGMTWKVLHHFKSEHGIEILDEIFPIPSQLLK